MRRHLVTYLTLAMTSWSGPAPAADVTVQLPAGDGFVVQDNTGGVEHLRVDEGTGNVSRNGALFVHTTGSNNTFVGELAGNTGPIGGFNSAFGRRALRSNTTGYGNSAFGASALADNTTGYLNSAVGSNALLFNTTGFGNSAFGANALADNTIGSQNSAFGRFALRRNTTGSDNSAFGASALDLNSTGDSNTAVGVNALFRNSTGDRNTAGGVDALRENTTGLRNTAFGEKALYENTTASFNSGFGTIALTSNTTGTENSAFGESALRDNTTGSYNSAFGRGALAANTLGSSNAAFGEDALLFSTTGSGNVGLGENAGLNQTTGSDNIYIRNEGVAAENGQIKIGTVGTHTQATIAGIHNNTSSGGIAVFVNSSGTLGTTTSSSRHKRNVRDLGDGSDVLMKLRPVAFEYREEVVEPGGEGIPQVGLIAEEVANVAPDLVVYDEDGEPYSVRYHLLPPMLLNELQKERRTNREQRELIANLQTRLERLEGRLGGHGSEAP